jgi:hypothetical protein
VLATAITVVALAALLFHLAFPEVSLDSASIALLILAAVPWLGAWIKSIEVAGMKVEFNDLREQLSQVREKVTEGFQTQARQQESVIARVARIESLLEFSGLPVSDERQERITDLVRTFLAYMRGRGAQFGAEPSVRVVPGTEFGQSVHYDPSTNELVVGHAMVDEDDFILRECCFRVFSRALGGCGHQAGGRRSDRERARPRGGQPDRGPRVLLRLQLQRAAALFRPGQRILDLERPELSLWAPALVLGHAELRAALSRRLARRHAEAARTLDQLADKLLGQTPS